MELNGYYGGLRLLKASIKVFYDYCRRNNIHLDARNFTIRYKSDIPLRLGLAGSSAIITACYKALMTFYGIVIPKPVLANLILSVETDELGISAGLQDRVAQVYETPVFMDFDRSIMEKQGYGNYETLDAENFLNLYIAFRRIFRRDRVTHNNLRRDSSEQAVLDAMKEADLTVQFKEALGRDCDR